MIYLLYDHLYSEPFVLFEDRVSIGDYLTIIKDKTIGLWMVVGNIHIDSIGHCILSLS